MTLAGSSGSGEYVGESEPDSSSSSPGFARAAGGVGATGRGTNAGGTGGGGTATTGLARMAGSSSGRPAGACAAALRALKAIALLLLRFFPMIFFLKNFLSKFLN